MAERPIDKKLEGRLFDLLEVKGRIRLGDLVLLRRRSRERGTTLLHVALEAGRVTPDFARRLAAEAGMSDPSRDAPGFDDESLTDSMLDSMVDAPPDEMAAPATTPGSSVRTGEPAHPRGEPQREVQRGADPARRSGPMPILRAPRPMDRASRDTLQQPPPQRSSLRSAPPRPPVLSPPEPAMRPLPSPANAGWLADRPTMQMDEPPDHRPSASMLDRISAPRPGRRSEPGERRPATPRVIGELRPRRRTPPVPPAPPAEGPPPLPPTPPPTPPPMATPVARLPERRSPPPLPAHAGHAPTMPDAIPAVLGEASVDLGSLELYDEEWADTAPPSGLGPGDSDDTGYPALPDGAARYALGDELGRGGMGQILAARDLALDRPVALKLMRPDAEQDVAHRLRFIDEARVTGQLQHPSVPTVYDLGRLGDGRLYFAMQRIEGRTVRDVIEDLRDGHGETVRHFGRVRLLTLFARVCRAVAFAHSRGVIHRDIKPDNIMLGEFGEVTLMDWGLAKPFEGADDGGPEPIATAREGESRFQTRSGDITGTPQYMPPEQADGRNDELGPHSDIYSLGAVLYELLTLEPPFDGPSARVVRRAVINDQVVPPSQRSPGRDVPHAIEQLCLQCLSKAANHRPRTASAVAERIEVFLEGEQDRERREAERRRLLEAGTEAARAYYTSFEQHRQLEAKTASMRARIAPWAPPAERGRLWAQEDAERAARIDAAHRLSEALAAYHAALAIDRDHPDARRAIASLYFNAFESAERDDDPVQMALYEHLIRAFDDEAGTFSRRLEGDGRLEVLTMPPGINVTLYTFRSVERVLQPINPRSLGTSPITEDPIPMGSYLLKVQAPGLSTTAVPISITRGQSLKLRLRLFPDRARGDDFVYVAAGPTQLGGDPHAQLARPARMIEVDSFFIGRRPVSAQSYREFLHHLAQVESPQAALDRAPRRSPSGPPLWKMDAIGRFTIPERDAQGHPWQADWPVVGISSADAEAYCEWLNETAGPGHRLPTEAEWEKAARGADGRAFPWGETWEPTFCRMGASQPGAPAPGPTGVFSTDASPYGVEDMAGGVSEWTATYLEGAQLRVVKGGHWASGPTECRSASRFTQPPDRVLPHLGFRVARSAPP